MERYTARQVQRAQAQEQLLKRLDCGEDFAALCQELSLTHSPLYLAELRRRYRLGGSTWEALIDHRHGHASKVTSVRRAWLREQKQTDLSLTQYELAARFQAEFQVALSQGRVSNVLRAEGVATPGGQRYRAPQDSALPVERAGAFFPSGGGAADGAAGPHDPGDPGPAGDLPGA